MLFLRLLLLSRGIDLPHMYLVHGENRTAMEPILPDAQREPGGVLHGPTLSNIPGAHIILFLEETAIDHFQSVERLD